MVIELHLLWHSNIKLMFFQGYSNYQLLINSVNVNVTKYNAVIPEIYPKTVSAVSYILLTRQPRKIFYTEKQNNSEIIGCQKLTAEEIVIRSSISRQ